jgi:hypothetical protein
MAVSTLRGEELSGQVAVCECPGELECAEH